MAINEACEVAKCICNGNVNSLLLELHPIQHAATDRPFVLRNRRQVEDLLGGSCFASIGLCDEIDSSRY